MYKCYTKLNEERWEAKFVGEKCDKGSGYSADNEEI